MSHTIPHSEETKRKIREGNLGKVVSAETRAKQSAAKKGKTSTRKGVKLSPELRAKLSAVHMGHKASAETKAKMSASRMGRVCVWKGKFGDQSANWKGGRVDKIKILRNSEAFKVWRLAVFTRDKFTCQECGSKVSNTFQAHHIVPVRKDLGRIFDVSNGITLCKKCHGKTWWNEDKFEEKYTSIVINLTLE